MFGWLVWMGGLKIAKQTEARLSYSVGAKVNIGNYESVDVHLSESEAYDVTELSQEEISLLTENRYLALKDKLDKRLHESVIEARE